jgi:DNA-binding transcriptional LysR family regulator
LASVPPFRPPDAESPPLTLQVLTERSLCLAVPATHPLARGDYVDVADLRGQRWIASPSAEPPCGGSLKPPTAALVEDCRGVVNMNVEVKRFRLGDHGAVRVDGG